MNVQLKATIDQEIKKLSEKIANHPEYDGSWWTDGLTDSIVNSIELILDQNTKTQSWLREQGYLED